MFLAALVIGAAFCEPAAAAASIEVHAAAAGR